MRITDNVVYLLILIAHSGSAKRIFDQKHRHFYSSHHFHIKSNKLFFNENEHTNSFKQEDKSDVHIRHQHHYETLRNASVKMYRQESNSQGPKIHWPVKKIAVVEGDIILGGLMMVHEREDTTFTCGPVMPQGGIQALEAMLYTLDRLNNAENKLLPDISLGAHILDDCDKDTYGLEMAVDFIKEELKHDPEEIFEYKMKEMRHGRPVFSMERTARFSYFMPS